MVSVLAVGVALTAGVPSLQAGEPKVPGLVVGPDAAETSARVEAPIGEVTVYSDRARVRRRGQVAVAAKGSAVVVRLPDLPGAVFLDTIRVAAKGGRVLRVEATPIERERLQIEQASKALDALEALDDRLTALDDRIGVDRWELDAVARLRPARGVPEEKREGRKGLVVDVSSWWKALDFLGQRATAARTRLLADDAERTKLEAERSQLRAVVASLNRGGFAERMVQVLAVIEPAGSSVDLELEYFVPGASWKPAYNLYFSSGRGVLTMETTAVVQQATGEAWPAAALAFSTAMPGRGIDLPELLTWTLGERSEFVPTLRARQPARVEPPLPMPPAPSDSLSVEAELVRKRLARAASAPDRHAASALGAAPGAAAGDVAASRIRAREESEIRDLVDDALADQPAAEPGAAGPLAQASQKGRRKYEKKDAERPVDDLLDGAERPTSPSLVAAAPAARMQSYRGEESEGVAQSAPTSVSWEDVVVVPRKSGGRGAPLTRPVPLSLLDVTTARRPPPLSDPYLPAVSGGGLDYVYRAPTPATVESSGKEVRVPLGSQAFRTAAFYQATPALAATAFLRARVRNDGKRPLLRGPATIFGDGEFVGTGELKTTGPSGDIELPLGADQDIRFTRQVVPSRKTTGLIVKEDETTYDVQIQVGNYKKQAVTVEVADQVPLSRNDEIHVKLLSTDPKPLGGADLDGVIRWRVDVPAGQTRTIKLRFQITRPKDWKLYQR